MKTSGASEASRAARRDREVTVHIAIGLPRFFDTPLGFGSTRLLNGFASVACKLLSSEIRATLAQLVERLIRNQQVAGSTPAGGSRNSIKNFSGSVDPGHP